MEQQHQERQEYFLSGKKSKENFDNHNHLKQCNLLL